jgi:PRTRC genetic system protein F
LSACAMAMSAWLRRHIGDTACLSPVFVLEPVGACSVLEIGEAVGGGGPAGSPAAAGAMRGIHIQWCESSVHRWTVGPGSEALEAAVPGLGATVLRLLERHGAAAYPLFTPSVLLDEASNQYWLGEADENALLDEECGDDAEAREVLRADMVTRAAIDAAFPPWALRSRAALSGRRLRLLAREHADGHVRRAAQLAFALARTGAHARFAARREGLFTGFGAVLCWRDDDIAVRVSDDYAHYAWQGECYDQIGEVVLPADEPDALRRWMRAMTPQLRAIGLIDRLLHLLSA